MVDVYLRYGFRLIHWTRGPDPESWKGPREPGWPKKDYPIEQYDPETRNIGVFTGHECAPGKFLVDVDLDWDGGLALAKILLPPTGFGLGRESRPLSHVFYFSPTALPSVSFRDLDNKSMIVELRAGDSSHETMVAPSIHPSGEIIILVADEEPSIIEDALRYVRRYAIAALIHKYLPGGFHHDARMALCGTLLRLKMPEEDVLAIGLALCQVQGTDAADMRNAFQSTRERLAGKTSKVAGAGALAKLIGEQGKAVVARIKEWLGAEAVDETGVIMSGGNAGLIVDQAEKALVASGMPIYQRGGFITRPVRLDHVVDDSGVHRETGSIVLVPVRDPWLLEQMASVLKWYTATKDGKLSQADPKEMYARMLMERREWRFPVLKGVVNCPTLTRDGRIVETPGFDPVSQLLLDFPVGRFPPIPQHPTYEDAMEALIRFIQPIRAFPFVDDAARSVALSAMLTGLVRCSLRTSPLHSFDAPAAGTGKSLLAEIVGLLATGARPPALSQGKSPEEDEKRLSTVLFAGDPVIHIDNCERPISGDFLCSMLSQEVVQARILGQSERRILPSTSLVLASGNNLIHAGDTSRRAVICRLDAHAERPETREFDFDCHEEVLRDRVELVVAGLTVLRAFKLSGYHPKLTPMGSFSDWEWIRGALVWLGCADPADTRNSILESDPKKDELLEVIGLWEAAFGDACISVADITPERARDLHNKLSEIACRGIWSSKSVGWWLRRNKGRIINGRAFNGNVRNNAMEWWLAGAESRPSGTVADVSDQLPM